MNTEWDLIIIGAGAGGLTAAQYGARANLKTLLIEEMASGGQAMLIDDLENYPGYPEPIKGFDFSQQMEKQAKNFGAEILLTSANSISKEGDIFTINTPKGDFTSKTVVIATGAKHRHVGVPGEKELSGRGVSYCATCDGPFFRNKKILVVGGGDAACDEAMFLAKLTDDLVVVHRRDRFRAQKSLAERVLNHEKIEVRFNHVVKEIKGDAKVTSVVLSRTDKEEEYEEEFDAVFIFIGSIPQTQLVEEMVELDEAGNIVTNELMETKIKGLFAVGDVRATPFRQLVVAASEGAIAAHYSSKHIDELEGHAY